MVCSTYSDFLWHWGRVNTQWSTCWVNKISVNCIIWSISIVFCFITSGLEHGQYDLYPDSATAPRQCGVPRRFSRKTFLRSCGQHSQSKYEWTGNYISGACAALDFTLSVLGKLSSESQGCKDYKNTFKPCHVGNHWITLTKYSQISTHVPGFNHFWGFLHHFVLACYFSNKSILWKIFEAEMLLRSQTTTPLQIFCWLMLYSQVIFKSVRVADDVLSSRALSVNGLK